jgi:hypothetical protein
VADIDAACDNMTASSVDSAQASKAAAEKGIKGSEEAVKAGLAALEGPAPKQAALIKEAANKAAQLQVGAPGSAGGCPSC